MTKGITTAQTAGRSAVVLDGRGVVEVSGEDRCAFLQGLISNDVTKVAPDRAVYAALLTAQGKYLHDFFIVEIGDSLFLDAEAARLDDLKRRLGIYRLRSKVTIGDASDRYLVAAAFGAAALDSLGLAGERGVATPLAGGVAYVDPRLVGLGARLLLPRAAGTGPLAERGFHIADPNLYDRMRLALGVPDGSRDLSIEKTILLEAGFDELDGIDWQKGCYVGQELTARTKHRALIKKRLMPVTVEGSLPPPGTPVMQGDEEAGEMRSGRDGLAIALLRLDAVNEGKPLTAAGARLAPQKPPWANF
jgi:folate-binding protein YgfZ